jgi:hypothetical protein
LAYLYIYTGIAVMRQHSSFAPPQKRNSLSVREKG